MMSAPGQSCRNDKDDDLHVGGDLTGIYDVAAVVSFAVCLHSIKTESHFGDGRHRGTATAATAATGTYSGELVNRSLESRHLGGRCRRRVAGRKDDQILICRGLEVGIHDDELEKGGIVGGHGVEFGSRGVIASKDRSRGHEQCGNGDIIVAIGVFRAAHIRPKDVVDAGHIGRTGEAGGGGISGASPDAMANASIRGRAEKESRLPPEPPGSAEGRKPGSDTTRQNVSHDCSLTC